MMIKWVFFVIHFDDLGIEPYDILRIKQKQVCTFLTHIVKVILFPLQNIFVINTNRSFIRSILLNVLSIDFHADHCSCDQ